MIFDGVFERFPDLRIGVIEQGAIWVPSWMRQMEAAFDAFSRHEERLARCRCDRATTSVGRSASRRIPTEDVGWIIAQAGPEVLPVLVRLSACRRRPPPDRALRGQPGTSTDADGTAFYRDNFVDLMGAGMSALAV